MNDPIATSLGILEGESLEEKEAELRLPPALQEGQASPSGYHKLELEGQKIRAVSVAGIETCIYLESQKLCFDIGRCPRFAISAPRVLFSHSHTDHINGILFHCATRGLLGHPAPEYWIPAVDLEPLREMLEAWQRLTRNRFPYRLKPVTAGEIHRFGRRSIQVFPAFHRIPAVSYVLRTRRQKLKAEYAHLAGPEIGALRKEGVDLFWEEEIAEVAYSGDSTFDVILQDPVFQTAQILILECTYIDPKRPVEDAREYGHIHLDEIAQHADLFQNKHILLSHFSKRYSAQEILHFLDTRLPSHLRSRIRPILPPL